MNYRKRKQEKNLSKKNYTLKGYDKDPSDAVCPYCGKKQKSCSYVNSLSRARARHACAKKYS